MTVLSKPFLSIILCFQNSFSPYITLMFCVNKLEYVGHSLMHSYLRCKRLLGGLEAHDALEAQAFLSDISLYMIFK